MGNWKTPPAKHVHDELHARCLVLDDGATRVAIVLADSVGIPREVFDEAKRQIHEHTGLPADHVLAAATHTHSATSSGWRNALAPDKEFCDYQKFVARRVSDGTSGDVDNTYSEPPGRLPPYARLRHVAGDVVQAVFAQCRNLQYHDWVPVGMVQRELELAVRKPTAEQLLHAKEMLADPQRPDKFPRERVYAQRIMRRQEAPTTIRAIVQALRIGDLGIAASPFETFAETGLEIKAKSPLKPTCTIELANGCYGYLLTPAQHQLGGYETWLGTNKVELDASTRLTAALLDMLGELQ